LKELYIANWWERFFAWLIDVIIVGIVTRIIFWYPFYWVPSFQQWGFDFGLSTLITFLYWTVLEGYKGQSIGKMIFNIKMTGEKGEKIDYTKAAIESFGKAFLLPIDVIIGVIARPNEKLRAFNILSHTIVIKLKYEPPKGVKYIKKRKR
jgi:uncharacterized RDD family membrane protein YckC